MQTIPIKIVQKCPYYSVKIVGHEAKVRADVAGKMIDEGFAVDTTGKRKPKPAKDAEA